MYVRVDVDAEKERTFGERYWCCSDSTGILEPLDLGRKTNANATTASNAKRSVTNDQTMDLIGLYRRRTE